MAQAESSSAAAPSAKAKRPPCILCIASGMAGSGKTSLMQRLNAHLHEAEEPYYVLNLDPAVRDVPFEANIDIRDTVDYKQVMQQYGLGPNGAIVTSLNLFATKFDQVLELLEKRADNCKYMLFDTPGQIEVFTWSASGAIITETLGASFPTVIVYVIDTPRCVNPVTFMSNMLYACSILYKTRLPIVLAFNKSDVLDASFAFEWMKDYETFQEALDAETSYLGSFSRSMCLVLEEFYTHLRAVALSAFTGDGIDDFFGAVHEAVEEYESEYMPMMEALRKERETKDVKEQQESLKKLAQDLQSSGKVVLDVSGHHHVDRDEDEEQELADSARAVHASDQLQAAFMSSQRKEDD